MKAYITVGVSASGKSTWTDLFIQQEAAKGQHWKKLERDCIRREILFRKQISPELDWSLWKMKWEKEVTDIFEERLESLITQGANIVISDTNLNRDRRMALQSRLQEEGYQVFFKLFPISYEEAVARDNRRKHGVGSSVIAKQMEMWDQQFIKDYHGTYDAPKAVMVDVDGTLAQMGRRNPYDYTKVRYDRPHEHVFDVVRGLQSQGYQVIVVSGRDDVCRDDTAQWIESFNLKNFTLLMRKTGDKRPDTIVKKELFDKHIRFHYDVSLVIDDRPSVCRMWRSIGLNVLQHGNPHVEF